MFYLVLMSVVAAAVAALSLAYIAHYDFGLSRQEIRTTAVVGAPGIALLVALGFFSKKLRKPKLSRRDSVHGEPTIASAACAASIGVAV